MVGIRCQIWSWKVRIYWEGVREKGGSDEPPEPPPPLVTDLMLSVTVLHGNENKTSIFIHITFFDFKSSIVFTI